MRVTLNATIATTETSHNMNDITDDNGKKLDSISYDTCTYNTCRTIICFNKYGSEKFKVTYEDVINNACM